MYTKYLTYLFSAILVIVLFSPVRVLQESRLFLTPEIFLLVSRHNNNSVNPKKIIPQTTPSEPSTKPSIPVLPINNDLVDLKVVSPNIRQDIRYATKNNFMKRRLYPVARCLLHKKVAEQLHQVQLNLEKSNLGLKVFDCYRPLSIQRQMWKILPDNRYVANPVQGSRHNRASAVDLTLVDLSSGKNKEMPSKFDDFSNRSHINYDGISIIAKKNRKFLQNCMEKQGFKGIQTEWWHYDSINWNQYPLIDISWN